MSTTLEKVKKYGNCYGSETFGFSSVGWTAVWFKSTAGSALAAFSPSAWSISSFLSSAENKTDWLNTESNCY